MIKPMDASLTQGLVTLAAILGFSGLSALMMLGLFKLTQRHRHSQAVARHRRKLG